MREEMRGLFLAIVLSIVAIFITNRFFPGQNRSGRRSCRYGRSAASPNAVAAGKNQSRRAYCCRRYG